MNKIFSWIFLPALTLVVVCDSAFAQKFPTDYSSRMVSASFNFSSAGGDLYEADGNRLISSEFNSSYSYFVTPGLALGGKLLLEIISQGEIGHTAWSIGPQIVYFIGGNRLKPPIKGTTYPYLRVGFLYTKIILDYKVSGELLSYTASATSVSFGAGILHMIYNNVGLFGEADYEIDNMTTEDEKLGYGNQFKFFAGFTIFIY